MKETLKKRIYSVGLYVFLLIAVFLVGVFGKDKWYAVLSSVIAVIYLLLLNEGIRLGYLLCGVYAVAYGVISYRNGLYAASFYHVFVLLPCGIYRFFKKKEEREGQIQFLRLRGWIFSCLVTVILGVAAFFLLQKIGDPQPLLDGATLAVSVVTAFLMAQKYIEMWVFNLFSSLIYIAVWTIQFFSIGVGLSIVALQTVVAFINIRGIILWYRQSKHSRKKNDECML